LVGWRLRLGRAKLPKPPAQFRVHAAAACSQRLRGAVKHGRNPDKLARCRGRIVKFTGRCSAWNLDLRTGAGRRPRLENVCATETAKISAGAAAKEEKDDTCDRGDHLRQRCPPGVSLGFPQAQAGADQACAGASRAEGAGGEDRDAETSMGGPDLHRRSCVSTY